MCSTLFNVILNNWDDEFGKELENELLLEVQSVNVLFNNRENYIRKFIQCFLPYMWKFVYFKRLIYNKHIADNLHNMEEKKFYCAYTSSKPRHLSWRNDYERKILNFKRAYGYVELIKIIEPSNGVERRKRRFVCRDDVDVLFDNSESIPGSALEAVCWENYTSPYVKLMKGLKALHPTIQQCVFLFLEDIYYVEDKVFNGFPVEYFISHC
jgi:hypothetical protein